MGDENISSMWMPQITHVADSNNPNENVLTIKLMMYMHAGEDVSVCDVLGFKV